MARQVVVQLIGDATKFSKTMRDAGKEAEGFGSRMGSAAGLVVKGGAIIAGAAIGVATAAGKMAADFQSSMANVQTLIGSGSEADLRLKELGQSVKDMSLATGKSLDDLSAGLYDVIGTFGDTAESADWLRVAAVAGSAGMSTTQEAIGLLSAVTKAYGDTSLEAAQKASDLAFQTANLGVTTFPEMAAAMGSVLPLAATMKVSQEELFGAMATLTGVTGNTSAVVTQLAASMNAVLKPNDSMKRALKELGFTGAKAGMDIVAEHGLVGALAMLNKTSTATSKDGLAKMLGSSDALLATLSLTGAQAEDFKNKTAAMGQAAGATAAAFEIQQKTVNATMGRIQAAIGVMLVSLGEKFLPAIQVAFDWVIERLPDISAIFESVFAAIGKVAGRAASFLAPVVEAFKTLAVVVEDIFAGDPGLALDDLAEGFGLTKAQLEPFIEALGRVGAAIGTVASQVVPAIGRAFDSFVKNILPPLTAAFAFIVADIVPRVAAAFSFIATDVIPRLIAALDFITGTVLPAVGEAFTWIVDNIWPPLLSAFETLAGTVIPVLISAFDTVVSVVKDNWPTIGSIATKVGGFVKTAVQAIDRAIKAVAPVITWLAKNIFPALAAAAGWLLSQIDTIFGAIGAVWDEVLDIGALVVGAIGWFSSLVSFITGVPGKIAGALGNLFKPLWDGFRRFINMLIRGWNNLKFTMPKVDLGPLGIVGGFTVGTPNLPYLHQGGIVPGPPGSDVLAMLQAGERVIPANRASGGGFTIIVQGDVYGDGIDRLADKLAMRLRLQGV